ncbi:MAG: sporulation protein YabP [Firmicutes bacterium]|nr:sporulation protein YabP [Bacillota bacterium]
MEDRDYDLAKDHEVHVFNREKVTIRGVVQVESFDDQEVMMDTEYGALTVRGEDLKIKQLDVEEGSFSVEGLVHGLQYSPNLGSRGKHKGKGLFERLFR